MVAKRDRGRRDDRDDRDRDYYDRDGPRRYYRRGYYHNNRFRGGMMSGASPMAWIGMTVAILGLAMNIGTVGFIYASVLADAAQNRRDIDRNFKEDSERAQNTTVAIERINTTIGGMGKLTTEIELVKYQLTTINTSLQELKRTFERPPAAIPTDRRR